MKVKNDSNIAGKVTHHDHLILDNGDEYVIWGYPGHIIVSAKSGKNLYITFQQSNAVKIESEEE